MTDGCGESAHSCTYGAWLKFVHERCTGIFSFKTNVDDSCVLKRALIPSHDITIDPRYSLDLTIKFLQHTRNKKSHEKLVDSAEHLFRSFSSEKCVFSFHVQ